MVDRNVVDRDAVAGLFTIITCDLHQLSSVLEDIQFSEVLDPSLARAARALCNQIAALSDAAAEQCGQAPIMELERWMMGQREIELLGSLGARTREAVPKA